MIATWMAYCVAVALLLGLGALALERSLRLGGGPGRWVWAAALVASLAVPAVSWLRPAPAAAPVPSQPAPEFRVGPLAFESTEVVGDVAPAGRLSLAALDRPLLVLWAVASAALLAFLAAAQLGLARRRCAWRTEMLDGLPVLVSGDVGPAVVGFVKTAIVVPGWALGAAPELRALMLAHEQEHRRAGDPRLLALAIVVLLLTPWNLALWWQARRLRLAVEMDCDARVLRRRADVRTYGALLLAVGERYSGRLVVAALSEPRSFLERRIRLMSGPGPSRPLARGAAFAAVAALLVWAACAGPRPARPVPPEPPARPETPPPAPEPSPSVPATPPAEPALPPRPEEAPAAPLPPLPGERTPPPDSARPVFTPFTVPPELLNRQEVAAALVELYPPLLKQAGVGGTTQVWLYVDDSGAVGKRLVRKSSGHPVLDSAALKVADVMRFTPALNRDRRVAVWIAMPLVFKAGASTGAQPGPGLESEEAHRGWVRRVLDVAERDRPWLGQPGAEAYLYALLDAAGSVERVVLDTVRPPSDNLTALLAEKFPGEHMRGFEHGGLSEFPARAMLPRVLTVYWFKRRGDAPGEGTPYSFRTYEKRRSADALPAGAAPSGSPAGQSRHHADGGARGRRTEPRASDDRHARWPRGSHDLERAAERPRVSAGAHAPPAAG